MRVIYLLLCALTCITPAFAQELEFLVPEEISQLKPNQHAQINSRTQRTLARAWEDFENGQAVNALSTLERILKENQHNPVASSYALYSASQILAQQEQYDQAIELIKSLIKLDSLNDKAISQQRELLAQLYIQEGKFKEANESLKNLITTNNSETTALREWHFLLSYSLFHTKDYQQSIHHAEQALALKYPNTEDIYQILLNSYLSLNDYPASQGIIKQLISLYPAKKHYWQQLLSVSVQLDDHKTALSSLELIKEKYSLTADETLHYAQLLLNEGSPLRAAKALEQAWNTQLIEQTSTNLKMLAYSWEQAGHIKQAIKALTSSNFIESSQNSPENIDCLKRLVQLLINQESWTNIIDQIERFSGPSLTRWLDNKTTVSEDKIWLSLELGRAFFHSKNISSAKEIFNRLDTLIDEPEASKLDNHYINTLVKPQLKQWKDYFKAQDQQISRT